MVSSDIKKKSNGCEQGTFYVLFYLYLLLFQRNTYPISIFCIIATEFCERFSFCGLRSKLRRNSFLPLFNLFFCSHTFFVPSKRTSTSRNVGHRCLSRIYYGVLCHSHRWSDMRRQHFRQISVKTTLETIFNYNPKFQDYFILFRHLFVRKLAHVSRCCSINRNFTHVSNNQRLIK